MSQPPDSQVTARCYRHPKREALVRCTRCDRPICPDCMRPASVGFHCPEDVNEGRRTVRAPRTAVGAQLWQSRAYVTITLVTLNVAAYLVTGLQSGADLTNPTGSQLFVDWQLEPFSVHHYDRFYEFLTSAFLHLSPLHILSNMITLIVIGPPLEALLGRWRFTVVYLLCALGGSVAIYTFGEVFGYTAGASGAIFGLFGACLVLVRKLGLDLQWLIGIIVLNFVLTFSVSGISKLGHVGGFVTGLVCALAIGGWPRSRRRIDTRIQVLGLSGVLVVLVLVTAIRTWTFPAALG